MSSSILLRSPPSESSPHAHSFVLGTAVINNNFVVSKTFVGLGAVTRHSRATHQVHRTAGDACSEIGCPHAAFGWRIHCGVEVTELSTNKQLSLSL
jgi:hypothetical protein